MQNSIATSGTERTAIAQRAATILVIEDDMSVQQLVARTLRNEGYQVLAAGDVAEGLHLSDTCATDIDLLLTDIMLPTTTGMAMARALFARRPRTPVLYMSGLASEVIHAMQFEGAPTGGFLQKPFSIPELLTGVREILRQGLPDVAPAPAAVRPAAPASDTSPSLHASEAVYQLESAVKCPQCHEPISKLQAVRLLRSQVNFTSTLPRRGRVLVCPSCLCIVPAELTTF